MAMKFSAFTYHLMESFKNLSRNGWMTFASVSAVTVTLLMLGVFLMITTNVNHISREIENDIEMRVHVKVAVEREEVAALHDTLDAIPEVDKVEFSSKENELKMLQKSLEQEHLYELYGGQENPLNDVYVVQLFEPDQVASVAKVIEDMPIVDKVNYGQGYVEGMFKFLSWVRQIGLILSIGLGFVAVFLIANTIRITIISRKREIGIMRLVGATNAFIRWPFFLEGIWLGILGSIIPIAVLSTAYVMIQDLIETKVNISFISLISAQPFLLQISGIIIGIGVLIGVIASTLSIRKHIKI